MSFAVAAAGGTLYLINSSGVPTALSLPVNATLSTVEMSRFAILTRHVVVVNGPAKSITIRPDGSTHPTAVAAPVHPPTTVAGAAGVLIGDYKMKVTFIVKDDMGNILAESDFSPISNTVTLSSHFLSANNIAISGEAAVNCRRLYRTASGGSVFFEWMDIDDNITSVITDNTADEALTISPPDELGAIPVGAELIATWKNRLWVKSRLHPDQVSFSADGLLYAWPIDFAFAIKPEGQDERGITAFMARRDELGVGKRDMLAKIVGDDDTDFAVVIIAVGVGPVSQEAAVVIQDIAYFLAEDGVYTWGPTGVECISDEKVRDWFASDTYFARTRFEQAVAHYDPTLNAYCLCVSAAGSSVNDRWVYYTMDDKKWWGPHKTGVVSGLPSAALLEDSNDLAIPVLGGSDGHIYRKQAAFTDGASTAIDFDADTKYFSGDAPDIVHNWGMLSVLSKILASGTLTITPKVGGLNASTQTAISHDMTLGRQRLRRLGTGRLAQLNLRQNTNAIGAQVYGIELPFTEVGRR